MAKSLFQRNQCKKRFTRLQVKQSIFLEKAIRYLRLIEVSRCYYLWCEVELSFCILSICVALRMLAVFCLQHVCGFISTITTYNIFCFLIKLDNFFIIINQQKLVFTIAWATNMKLGIR